MGGALRVCAHETSARRLRRGTISAHCSFQEAFLAFLVLMDDVDVKARFTCACHDQLLLSHGGMQCSVVDPCRPGPEVPVTVGSLYVGSLYGERVHLLSSPRGPRRGPCRP